MFLFVDVPGKRKRDDKPDRTKYGNGNVENFRVFAGIDNGAGKYAIYVAYFAFTRRSVMASNKVKRYKKAD